MPIGYVPCDRIVVGYNKYFVEQAVVVAAVVGVFFGAAVEVTVVAVVAVVVVASSIVFVGWSHNSAHILSFPAPTRPLSCWTYCDCYDDAGIRSCLQPPADQ